MKMQIGDIEVPAVWAICHECGGEGKSSAYLGAYTAEEFDEAFNDNGKADYFGGAYDRTCEHCKGSGKVQEPDLRGLTAEQRDYVAGWAQEEAEYRAMCEAERRMGC